MNITPEILPLAIAALAGIIMAIQGSINSALGKVIGLWEATLVVHVVGLLLVTVLLFVCRLGDGCLANISHVPWYTYLGGILGVLIVYGVVSTMPKVGVAPATTAIIVGQVFTAGLVDHFGLFGMEKIPFSLWNVLGTLLMAGGAWLILKQ
ncbi:DMT family transporter [Pelotomaculum isophthalicicum]|uniref:DMT family transporter n=1 Tax=Pelotomaculum isophthalicicum TaxID=342448 RepID=UPI003B849DD6